MDNLLLHSVFDSFLDAILAHLGAKFAILAPLGAPLGNLGRLVGQKMLPKPLLELLLRYWAPSWLQNTPETAPKG